VQTLICFNRCFCGDIIQKVIKFKYKIKKNIKISYCRNGHSYDDIVINLNRKR
jgi:hypothetical protein